MTFLRTLLQMKEEDEKQKRERGEKVEKFEETDKKNRSLKENKGFFFFLKKKRPEIK